jgi:hypothetical protein
VNERVELGPVVLAVVADVAPHDVLLDAGAADLLGAVEQRGLLGRVEERVVLEGEARAARHGRLGWGECESSG